MPIAIMFLNKWKNVLERDHCGKDDIFHGRDRTKEKKCLLFIDATVLTYDKDCGSRASFQYLKFFLQFYVLSIHISLGILKQI